MINQTTIARILDTAPIEAVIGEFVHLRKAGSSYKGLCPFHEEKTPSFVVSPTKRLYKCFGCGKGGNVVHFIMEHEHLNYYEALKWLAEKYHIEIAEHSLSPKEIQSRNLRESLFVLNDFARDYFQESLYSHSDILKDNPSDGLSYLRQRGFSDEILRKFQVGYSPSQNDALYCEAGRKGYSETLLLQSGLCYQSNHATHPQDRSS